MKMNIDLIYPINSIYASSVNVSPQTIFGGTWEAVPRTVGEYKDSTEVKTNITGGSWQTIRQTTLTPGTWLICGGTNSGGTGGWTARFAGGAPESRQSAHNTDGNVYSTEHKNIVKVASNTTIYLQVWSASARYIWGDLYAYRLDGLGSDLYAWKRTA